MLYDRFREPPSDVFLLPHMSIPSNDAVEPAITALSFPLSLSIAALLESFFDNLSLSLSLSDGTFDHLFLLCSPKISQPSRLMTLLLLLITSTTSNDILHQSSSVSELQ